MNKIKEGLDMNPIYDEIHKQGHGIIRIETFEDYILLYTGTEEEYCNDKFQEYRTKELIRYTGLSEEEIIDFARMSKEEKEQIKYTVKYKKLKQEIEELENKMIK